MRLLITGADGFVGTHAARVFRERGDDVVELRGAATPRSDSARTIELRDAAAVRETIAWAKPDGILHLAGASSVARSHDNPGESFEVNTLGTVHLLDAVRRDAPSARVVIVSSGEVYGSVPGEHAAIETDSLNPISPYASSKVAAEIAAKQFHASYGLAVVIARPFNHLGRGQAPHFVVPSFARQIRAIAASGKGDLRVGNLEAIRDFSHVLDVVDAYRVLLDRGVAGEAYNIASGVGRSVLSLLAELIAMARVDVKPSVDLNRMRPVELSSLIGNASKLRAVGWNPNRSVTDALREALEEAQPS